MDGNRGSVLVACPTYAGKEYCLDEWVAGFRALQYEPKYAYQVDNTKVSQKYFELIKSKGIDCTHIQPWHDWDRTFFACWKLMLQRAQQLGCHWLFSVEADNVPAPESLDIMVNTALYAKIHLLTHGYPMHESARVASGIAKDTFFYDELGCMLMTTQLLERAVDEFEEYGNIVSAIFGTERRYRGGYCKLTNRFEVKHLDGYQQSFQNLSGSEIPGLIMPTPQMPPNYGTELPKCLQES